MRVFKVQVQVLVIHWKNKEILYVPIRYLQILETTISMADDNGYIDENDLINDYYDDMEGDYNEEIDGVDESAPPPPSQPKKNETENDYDAFMNATMLEEEEPSPAANTLQVTTTASTLNQQNLISTVGHRRENVPSTVTLNMPSSKHDKLINRNTQTDVNSSLYGFERYV